MAGAVLGQDKPASGRRVPWSRSRSTESEVTLLLNYDSVTLSDLKATLLRLSYVLKYLHRITKKLIYEQGETIGPGHRWYSDDRAQLSKPFVNISTLLIQRQCYTVSLESYTIQIKI